ncbi:hypothetical protein DID88_004813 [Monilinia fructigena]|uniref:Uncharacterized protein n=1 Tax=Monilinia fructigena TaxID=38457 RepID=A0A395IS76_9HELO|nr:hypothetical protein DID88_004813 [Monilinia fructigena]
MRHPILPPIPGHHVGRNASPPRLIDDVMQGAHVVVAPHLRVPVAPRLQRVVLPADADPAVAPPGCEKVLIGKLIGAEFGVVRADEVPHVGPGGEAGGEDEEAGVELGVGVWMGGALVVWGTWGRARRG